MKAVSCREALVAAKRGIRAAFPNVTRKWTVVVWFGERGQWHKMESAEDEADNCAFCKLKELHQRANDRRVGCLKCPLYTRGRGCCDGHYASFHEHVSGWYREKNFEALEEAKKVLAFIKKRRKAWEKKGKKT